jgi:hypothetical protein
LRCDIAHVHLPIQQDGNDAQAGWVTEGAKQVGKVCGGRFLEYHGQYMNNCSSIQYFKTKEENRQVAALFCQVPLKR